MSGGGGRSHLGSVPSYLRVGTPLLPVSRGGWHRCGRGGVATILDQSEELARVKQRIRALTERTVERGCTEAEALAAAEMVGRLLERYALSMDEVDLRAAACVVVRVPAGGRRRRPVDTCVPAIARFCGCKVWLEREDDGGAH